MFQFANPENIFLLLIVPTLIALFAFGWYQKKVALQRFVSANLEPLISFQQSRPKWFLKVALLLLSITFLVLTMMRPQGNPTTTMVKKRGRDLVFVIDVSRSMLAEDLKPNRLERAKQLVGDVVDILEGDRIGLLIFSGATAIKSPLTLDYNYFKNILSQINPSDINRGGTHIGDAIRMVTERLFYDQDNKFRDIILITDGEDHESFPIEAAKEAASRGIRIHTVGLGDPDGANIPLRKSGSYALLKYQSQTVKTKLDETTLKKVAEITKGVFIPVRTNLVELDKLYTTYIATAEKREMESKESKLWSELFQFFLGIAILLLILEFILGEQKLISRKF